MHHPVLRIRAASGAHALAITFAAVAATCATACGNPSAAPAPPISTSAVDATLPGQLARAAALMIEIRSAGETCDGVTRTFLQGTRDGNQVWNAECAGGRAYGVVAKADSSMEIVPCSALEALTGSKCFEKF
jgi:hypothetical protein